MAEQSAKSTKKVVARNKKAYYEYFVLEKYEAGIELRGTEVKSIRQGQLNLRDAWCGIINGEIFLNGMHVSPYEKGNIFNSEPLRVRRLLMHKKEILRLKAEVQQKGLALIPLSVYFYKGRAKVKIGLCKGKKMHDKRAVEASKSAARDIDRSLREHERS